MKHITFDMGNRVFSGPVIDMLKSQECPVGGQVSKAKAKGIENVPGKFESLVEDWGAEFEEGVELTIEAIASDDVKKNLIFPNRQSM
jgi:hypothetical protein